MVNLSKQWPPEVVNTCVKCRKCGEPILLVYDASIRDKHDECGGKPTVYDKSLLGVE